MMLVEAISNFQFVNPAAMDKFGAREQRHELEDYLAAHLLELLDLLDHSLKLSYIV